MSWELLYFLVELLDCSGERLRLQTPGFGPDLVYQSYRVDSCQEPEDCPVDDIDFAVYLDGEYVGWTSRGFCTQYETPEEGWITEYWLRVEAPDPQCPSDCEYLGSGAISITTEIFSNSFEGRR